MNTAGPKNKTSLNSEIPSRLGAVDTMCSEIRVFLEGNGLAVLCFPVELAARECLNNAIIHGNRRDTGKKVALSLRIGRKWIRLQVTDEGPGFNWRKARKTLPWDDATTGGRGLSINALYADRMAFSRKGNRITLWMRKRRTAMSDYTVERNENQGLVTLKGDLTAALVPDLQAALKTVLEEGADELVFDLGSTVMLDSSGIGLLIAAGNSLAGKNGKIRVINVSDDIGQLLRSMRLTGRLNVSGHEAQEANHG